MPIVLVMSEMGQQETFGWSLFRQGAPLASPPVFSGLSRLLFVSRSTSALDLDQVQVVSAGTL